MTTLILGSIAVAACVGLAATYRKPRRKPPLEIQPPLRIAERPRMYRVAEGVWRDDLGGYVFSTSYLHKLATQAPALSGVTLLNVAVRVAMDADGVPQIAEAA